MSACVRVLQCMPCGLCLCLSRPRVSRRRREPVASGAGRRAGSNGDLAARGIGWFPGSGRESRAVSNSTGGGTVRASSGGPLKKTMKFRTHACRQACARRRPSSIVASSVGRAIPTTGAARRVNRNVLPLHTARPREPQPRARHGDTGARGGPRAGGEGRGRLAQPQASIVFGRPSSVPRIQGTGN